MKQRWEWMYNSGRRSEHLAANRRAKAAYKGMWYMPYGGVALP